MPDMFVQSFTHLSDMPKSDRALAMLQKVASLVKPIMRKHGWVLAVLSEFFPGSPNLVGLNVNGGEKILLRLRPAWAPDTFYEEDDVVRVMLHELTHNVHGPHDEQFYKLLAELEDEYDALQRSGYAGEGFFSPGHRLGAGVSHNLPPHLARAKAAEAAEKRRQLSAINKGGGRLGGRVSALNNLSPRELAARAAERRRQDELTCGLGSVALHEASKANKTSIASRTVIDLTSDEDAATGTLKPKVVSRQSRSYPVLSGHRDPHYPNLTEGQWACPVCTLINDAIVLQCAACLSEKPSSMSSGWTCLTCGESGIPHQLWACQSCGTIKTESSIG